MNGDVFLKEIGEKLDNELRQFKDEILKLSKEQIYENAYKIMSMQYINDLINEYVYKLSAIKIRSLLRQKDILERIYYEWMKEPFVEEGDLNVCIKQFIERIGMEDEYGKISMYEKFSAWRMA